MKKNFSSFLMAITIALCCTACAKDIVEGDNTPAPQTSLTILADREDFLSGNTRTAYSGISATFEVGDRIGVYVVNGTTRVASNVCFTWDGAKWNGASDLTYDAGYAYYAYYPYVASPYTPDFTQSGIKNQFRLFIDDASNKFHQADQTTKAAFNASDLCIAQATHLAPRLIKFSLEHKKGLAVFNGKDAAAATFSGSNLPYTVDSERYFLMPYGTATSFTEDIGGTYALHAAIGKYVTHPIVDVPLTFIALENGTFRFSQSGLSYSLDDGETWTALAANTNTPTVTAGNKIMWKNNTAMTPTSLNGIGYFSSTRAFDVEGNIMSLYYGSATIGEKNLSGKTYAFYKLFINAKVRNAKKLKLPATTLANLCYQQMFVNCLSLTTAPSILPAMTLASNCYGGMFQGCTSLTETPQLPATTLANSCYTAMFNGCTALTDAPDLPATALANSCYSEMFEGCTSLTTAPELPATELVSYCYQEMFNNCSNLDYVKAAFTTEPSLAYTTDWLYGVAATGTFYKNSAASWNVTGVSGVPSSWTVETYTP